MHALFHSTALYSLTRLPDQTALETARRELETCQQELDSTRRQLDATRDDLAASEQARDAVHAEVCCVACRGLWPRMCRDYRCVTSVFVLPPVIATHAFNETRALCRYVFCRSYLGC